MSPSHRRIPILPNPWPPDTIERLITHAVTVVGLAPVAYKLIALWVEDRKARKIRIVRGEHGIELDVQGGVSDRELERALNKFNKLSPDGEKVEVTILPKGLDSSIPFEMAREAAADPTKKKKK